MTKTQQDAPAFPPGRYGRRREPGRRAARWPVFALAGLALLAGLAIAVKLYRQYADPVYEPRVIAVRDISERGLTVEFEVRVPAGKGAVCTVRARDYSGTTIGQTSTTVAPGAPDQTVLHATGTVVTSAKPFHGDVIGCGPGL